MELFQKENILHFYQILSIKKRKGNYYGRRKNGYRGTGKYRRKYGC